MPPGITGMETAKVIKGLGSKAKMYLLSGDADMIKPDAVKAAGMDGMLMKPIKKDVLSKWIATVK